VLNLFAYTGAFGVAAAAGGARSTTNVDNKRSALEGGRRNYALNGLEGNTRSFLDSDAIRFLNRTARGRGRYDLVVVDPPPRFRRPGGRRFRVHDGYGRLIARSLRVLDTGGVLIAGLNALGVDDGAFEGHLAAAAEETGARLRIVERIGAGSDFPATRNRPSARFAVCAVEGVNGQSGGG
jgi:23S rRNA (cytosine1962-C5)-methyltransferase